jgi:biopolymer transport protein ExbD
MTNHHEPQGVITGINVTPLVDITLVLLIIFIVTAKLVVAPAVPMDLPRATQSSAVQTVFAVMIPLNGPMLVNGAAVADDAELMRLARSHVARDPETRAVIQADGSVPHRSVIHTLDVIQLSGIHKVAFGALPPEPSQP